jgi:hypothetical protein
MTTTDDQVRFFQIGGLRADVTHLWKTNPVAHGSRKFQWIYRVCRLVAVVDGVATIRLTGLKSRPTRQVLASEVIPLPDKAAVKTLPLSS